MRRARLGLLAVVATLLTACGGEEGIEVSGMITRLTSTEVCLPDDGPGADGYGGTCYQIDGSSEVESGLAEGDFVTVRASDEVVIELTKIPAPEEP